MESDEFDSFINQMLDAKQLSGVTDDVREMLVADLKQRLLDQINRALVDALPDDKMTAFEGLLDNPDATDEDIRQFIETSGVDTKHVVAATMLKFRDLYIETPKS